MVPEGGINPWQVDGRQLSKPVVIAVQGTCLTLGIELILASDMAVAAQSTRFAQIEVGRGILPFGGATIRFPRVAGWGNAMRWILTGDSFDAAEAHRMGLVQEIVPDGEQLPRRSGARAAHRLAGAAGRAGRPWRTPGSRSGRATPPPRRNCRASSRGSAAPRMPPSACSPSSPARRPPSSAASGGLPQKRMRQRSLKRMNEYDVIVIGGGAAGENVADRAVQGGLSAVIVEAELVGGDCSYWACMPSKALLRSGIVLRAASSVRGAAEAVTGTLDVPAVLRAPQQLHPQLGRRQPGDWMDGAGIDLIRGHGRLAGVEDRGGDRRGRNGHAR